MPARLEGKTAVITGAGSGVGREIAKLFAAEGATVAALDLIVDAAHETVRSIKEAGGTAFAVEVDIADATSVRAAAEWVAKQAQRVDVLVNNAGILDGFTPLLETS